MFDDFVEKLNKLENDVRKLSTANQPYQGDWIQLNVADFGDLTPVKTYIDVTGFIPSKKFSKGDKIRVDHLDAIAYYTVLFIDDINKRIFLKLTSLVPNFSSYVPTFQIYYSKLTTPNGVNSSFFTSVNISPISGTPTAYTANCWFVGGIVFVNYNISANLNAASIVTIDLPVAIDPLANVFISPTMRPSFNTTYPTSINGFVLAIVANPYNQIQVSRSDGANWGTISNWSANFTIAYEYYSL